MPTEWKLKEQIVALLEKMLSPDATVLHNQLLPEKGTTKPRQCDAVVWYGVPPRRTLAAIIEVQDRDEKVGIGDFDAWCQKRDDLGAGRLICVSKVGFTGPVQQKAAFQGEDKAVLMTLKPPDEFLEFLQFREILWQADILLDRSGAVCWQLECPRANLTFDTRVFAVPGCPELQSLSDLADKALLRGVARDVVVEPLSSDKVLRKYRVGFGRDGKPIWYETDARQYVVWEAILADTIQHVSLRLPVEILTYKQTTINNALAWVAVGKGSYEGNDFYFQQAFQRDASGAIQVWPPAVSKIAGLTTVDSHTMYLVKRESNSESCPGPA